MPRLVSVALCLFILLVTAGVGALLTESERRISPHEHASLVIAGKKLSVRYGRPYKKGREIFGALVPWDQVWRMGADEATTLTTEADLMVGSIEVPRGTYSLFTIPSQKGWTLIVNKVAKQWGAYGYDPGQDIGRTAMKVITDGPPVEQLTVTLEAAAEDKSRGALKMAWDKMLTSVEIVVR